MPWTSWKTLASPKFLGGWGLKIPALFAKALVAKNVWNVIHGSCLWVQIALQKCVYPLSLLDWIRASVKKKRCMSICWKAVLWSFDLIGNYLVWKAENGADVRLGLDPWVGCKWRHILPSFLLDKLHSLGCYFLKDIGCPGVFLLMEQGWLSTELIGLVEQQEVTCRENFKNPP